VIQVTNFYCQFVAGERVDYAQANGLLCYLCRK
jgi:hypothetical protein